MSDCCDRCGRRAALIARDGKPYCKHHADRLPPYLRRPPKIKTVEWKDASCMHR